MGCIQSYFKKATGTSSRNSPSEEGKKFPGHAREVRTITEMPTVAITSPQEDTSDKKEFVPQTKTDDTSKDISTVSSKEVEKDSGVMNKQHVTQKSEGVKMPTSNSNIDNIDKIEYESSFISRSNINQPKPLVNTQNNKYWMNDVVCESTTYPNSIVTRAIVETRTGDQKEDIKGEEKPESGEKKVLERKKTHEIVKEIVSEEFSKSTSTRVDQKKVTNVSQQVGKGVIGEVSVVTIEKKDIIESESTTGVKDGKPATVELSELKLNVKKLEATLLEGIKAAGKIQLGKPTEEENDELKEREIKHNAMETNNVKKELKKPQVLELKKTTTAKNMADEKPKDNVKKKENDSKHVETKVDLKKPEVVEDPTTKNVEDKTQQSLVEPNEVNVVRKPEVVDVLTKTKEVAVEEEKKIEIEEPEPRYIVTEDTTKEEGVTVDSGTWKSEGITETDISEYCETGNDDSITPAEGIENISFDDKSPIVESPSAGEEITKQISNTSLNTIGDDSEDISDADTNIDVSKIKMKRFDTISSNGESSYNKSLVDPIEEGHAPSISEEYDKQLEEFTNQLKESDFGVLDVFETEAKHEAVVEIAKVEVDRICEQALEKTAEYYEKLATPALRELEELTYASKCFLSANGSLSGEKENTYESLSLPDERSMRPTTEEDVIRAMLKTGSSVDERIGKFTLDSKPHSVEREDSLDFPLPLPPALDDIPAQDYAELDIPEEELKCIKSPNKEEDAEKELILAASKIQAGFRGFKVRKQMENMKKPSRVEDSKSIKPPSKEEIADEDLSAAVTKIQAGIRGFLVRKKIENMLNMMANSYEEEEEEESKGITPAKALFSRPQSFFFKERSEEELTLAANKIQARYRGYLVRKELENLKKESNNELKCIKTSNKEEGSQDLSLAASKIQAGVRGYLVRKQLENMKKGSVELEEIKERMKQKGKRMSLDSKLADIDNIRSLKSLQDPVKGEDEAALKIQTSFRNYKARKSICVGSGVEKFYKLDKPSNIGVIPETEENVQSPNGASSSISLAEKVHDKKIDTPPVASNSGQVVLDQEDKDLIEQAVLKIQSSYRGYAARKDIKKTKSVVSKIQATFRGKMKKQVNKDNKDNKEEVKKDEGLVRSSSCSNLMSLKEKSAMKIQAGVRGYLTRKRHSIQNTAALKIQHRYREYKSKQQNQESGENDSGSDQEEEHQ